MSIFLVVALIFQFTWNSKGAIDDGNYGVDVSFPMHYRFSPEQSNTAQVLNKIFMVRYFV